MKILLILNPRSGRKKALKEKASLENILKSKGEVLTYITNGKTDNEEIRKIKREEPLIQLVVACGGDGTLNMAMTALRESDDLLFIFLPYGTINVFARDNGYLMNPVKALEKIINDWNVKMIYPGYSGDRSFILMKSIGFDSYLVEKVETKGKTLMTFSYVIAFLQNILKYNFKKKYKIILDGKEEHEASFAVVSNCKKYGGFFQFTPHPVFDKDFFFVALFSGKSFLELLFFILKVFFNRHIYSPKVKILKAKKVRIEGNGRTQLDGEIGFHLPVDIKKGRGVYFVLPNE
ncbi:MAG: hypothetical protein A2Y41_05045 [Spirochaetes bacterium GWB1_36_13]|nr:MAG: hypothetical protein A2Y41_05045 [Spirochaetes bacterium GWB1_36_13]